MYIRVEFTKGRHVLEAMCEGALMPVGDWEACALLTGTGAFLGSFDKLQLCVLLVWSSITFDPGSTVFHEPGRCPKYSPRSCSFLLALTGCSPSCRLCGLGERTGLGLRLVAGMWVHPGGLQHHFSCRYHTFSWPPMIWF